jgi:hypothetical protein
MKEFAVVDASCCSPLWWNFETDVRGNRTPHTPNDPNLLLIYKAGEKIQNRSTDTALTQDPTEDAGAVGTSRQVERDFSFFKHHLSRQSCIRAAVSEALIAMRGFEEQQLLTIMNEVPENEIVKACERKLGERNTLEKKQMKKFQKEVEDARQALKKENDLKIERFLLSRAREAGFWNFGNSWSVEKSLEYLSKVDSYKEERTSGWRGRVRKLGAEKLKEICVEEAVKQQRMTVDGEGEAREERRIAAHKS